MSPPGRPKGEYRSAQHVGGPVNVAFGIRRLAPRDVAEAAPALAAIFVDAVADGASIGFMADLTAERAAGYWRGLAAAMGERVVLAGSDAEGIAGVVIVAPLATGFQPHRAEILKLVVHRRARGRGLGAALLRAAEDAARALDRTVLTLWTRHGGGAEPLYSGLGWTLAGIIPDDSLRPDGTLCDAAIYYKRIGR
jgi:GNAT superfamily N-acetyltransferase